MSCHERNPMEIIIGDVQVRIARENNADSEFENQSFDRSRLSKPTSMTHPTAMLINIECHNNPRFHNHLGPNLRGRSRFAGTLHLHAHHHLCPQNCRHDNHPLDRY